MRYVLPSLRADIAKNKKLSYHYYEAMRKALFKPSAFIKGILLPLCELVDFSIKEASIFGSIVMKSSIPLAHASAAIVKICELGYSGPTSFILKTLLLKKYAFGYIVFDALLAYFAKY
jgi:essential nuclear protein 1